MNLGGVTVEDYEDFFRSKWIAIAEALGYSYDQKVDSEWAYFSVKKK
jgi:hypothetical protein